MIAPNAYPGPPGIIGPNAAQHVPQTLGKYGYKGGGDYFFYNYQGVTDDIPATDRQSFYGSFTRDICDKYLTVFADFKYTRSFFDPQFRAIRLAVMHSTDRTAWDLAQAASVCRSRIRLTRLPSLMPPCFTTASASLLRLAYAFALLMMSRHTGQNYYSRCFVR